MGQGMPVLPARTVIKWVIVAGESTYGAEQYQAECIALETPSLPRTHGARIQTPFQRPGDRGMRSSIRINEQAFL